MKPAINKKAQKQVNLKCFYTNADQFVNKRDDLLLRIAKDSPDLILITEVIPKNQSNPITDALLEIDGYLPCFNFEPNNKDLGASGIRGVAIYSKECLNATEVKFNEEDYRDHLWIEIPSSKGPLLVGCVYRSPSDDANKDACMRSSRKVSKLIMSAVERNENILIVGDFNYKDIDWSNDSAPPEKQHLNHFIDTLHDCYLHQHVTEPTRYRSNETPSLLDLILITDEDSIQDIEYLSPLGESDHICLIFDILTSKQKDHSVIPNEPNIHKTNYHAVHEELSRYNWEEELDTTFEAGYDKFIDSIVFLVDKHSPRKTQPKTRRNIFMTNAAIRLRNKKQRSWKRYVTTKTERDKCAFNTNKNELRLLTRKLRSDFEKSLAESIKTKPKLFWKYTSSRLKSKQRIPTLERPDGTKATTSQQKAEVLNDFFSSVFTIEDVENIPPARRYQFDNSLKTVHITPEVVWDKLTKLDPNKSSNDKCHPHLLRELSDSICTPLSILFNKSLKEGVHESWRKAFITAVHKKGKKSDPSYYRPISITSVISKIMESIMRDTIVEHMTKNNLFADEQHGFVPGRDCVSQLLLCLEEWTNRIEYGECFDVIYTDFSKAFDSVPHERLLVKLKSIGIEGDILFWIKSFLNRRSQCVNVNGEKSGWKQVLSGIPQGSVIGPILFVIFINDMPEEVIVNYTKMFADDCKLYGTVGSAQDNSIQSDLNNLVKWSEKWQLPFNASKCKVIHFGHKNANTDYYMNDVCLQTVRSEKDLGVIVDSDLKFHEHTAAASKKANQVLGIIKKSYVTRDARTMSTLYKALVRPHLEYANVIWGPFFKADMEMVEAVQHRATKLIPELRNFPYEDRLRNLELPSLTYRRRRGDMIQLYKIMNSMVRIDPKILFTPLSSNSVTRGHNQKLFKHHAKKIARSQYFSQRAINDWNGLTQYIVDAPTLNTFKNRLDEFWKERLYTTDQSA